MITETLLKINSTTLPGIKSYKVQRNKLWADAGRNMAGNLRSTLIGIFPKLLVEFTYLTRAQMSTVIGLLDNGSFTVEWYDEYTDTVKSGTFYAGDYDIPLFSKSTAVYASFSVNLIPFNKLT